MKFGEGVEQWRSASDIPRQIDSEQEAFEKRKEMLAKSTNVVEALSLYMGGKVTPVVASRDLDSSAFYVDLLFRLDDDYLFYYSVFPTFDGYDMWKVSFPVGRAHWNDTEVFGKVELEGPQIACEFWNRDAFTRQDPLLASDLVKKISRQSRPPIPADEMYEGAPFIEHTVERFLHKHPKCVDLRVN